MRKHQKQAVQKPENIIRVQTSSGHYDHSHSPGPGEEHHIRLDHGLVGTKAVTVAMALGTPGVQQRYRHADPSLPSQTSVPLVKVATEIPNSHRETTK